MKILDDSQAQRYGGDTYAIAFLLNDKQNKAAQPAPFKIHPDAVLPITQTSIGKPWLPGQMGANSKHAAKPGVASQIDALEWHRQRAGGEIVDFIVNQNTMNASVIIRIDPEWVDTVRSGKISKYVSPMISNFEQDVNGELISGEIVHIHSVDVPGYEPAVAQFAGVCTGEYASCRTNLDTLAAAGRMRASAMMAEVGHRLDHLKTVAAAGCQCVTVAAAWQELEHPRGQPDNSGQFVEKAKQSIDRLKESIGNKPPKSEKPKGPYEDIDLGLIKYIESTINGERYEENGGSFFLTRGGDLIGMTWDEAEDPDLQGMFEGGVEHETIFAGILDEAGIDDIHSMEEFMRVTGMIRYGRTGGGTYAEIYHPPTSAQRDRLSEDAEGLAYDLIGNMENANEVFFRRSIGAAGEWRDEDHPRGQPSNSGQFVEKVNKSIDRLKESMSPKTDKFEPKNTKLPEDDYGQFATFYFDDRTRRLVEEYNPEYDWEIMGEDFPVVDDMEKVEEMMEILEEYITLDGMGYINAGHQDAYDESHTVYRGMSMPNFKAYLEHGGKTGMHQRDNYTPDEDIDFVSTSLSVDVANEFGLGRDGVTLVFDTSDIPDEDVDVVEYENRPDWHIKKDGKRIRPDERFGGTHSAKYYQEREVRIKSKSEPRLEAILVPAFSKEDTLSELKELYKKYDLNVGVYDVKGVPISMGATAAATGTVSACDQLIQTIDTVSAAWNPFKHPRGQPSNSGQFKKKDGGSLPNIEQKKNVANLLPKLNQLQHHVNKEEAMSMAMTAIENLIQVIQQVGVAGTASAAGWDEDKHPRGQPANSGQFVENVNKSIDKLKEGMDTKTDDTPYLKQHAEQVKNIDVDAMAKELDDAFSGDDIYWDMSTALGHVENALKTDNGGLDSEVMKRAARTMENKIVDDESLNIPHNLSKDVLMALERKYNKHPDEEWVDQFVKDGKWTSVVYRYPGDAYRLFPNATTRQVSALSNAVDTIYMKTYVESEHLWRGMSKQELVRLLEGDRLPRVKSFTISADVAIQFSLHAGELTRAVVEIKREKLHDKLHHQGYDILGDGDAGDRGNRQGMDFIHEWEHQMDGYDWDELESPTIYLPQDEGGWRDEELQSMIEKKGGTVKWLKAVA